MDNNAASIGLMGTLILFVCIVAILLWALKKTIWSTTVHKPTTEEQAEMDDMGDRYIYGKYIVALQVDPHRTMAEKDWQWLLNYEEKHNIPKNERLEERYCHGRS